MLISIRKNNIDERYSFLRIDSFLITPERAGWLYKENDMQDDLIPIGKRIRKSIEESELTQRAIADMMDIHEKQVSRWVCRKQAITLRRLMQLATILDVSVDYLLFGDTNEQK